MSNKKRIMCFGDSLTWGWIPTEEGAPTTRYDLDERWTGAMHANLGTDFEIVEEGLSARTTNIDDPTDPRLNGSAYLPSALASHLPLDFVVVMLGTNDTKSYFHRSAYEIATGMSQLLVHIGKSAGGVGTPYPAPTPLLVAPPALEAMPHPWFQGMFEGAHDKTREMAKHYASLADFFKVDFVDAGQVIRTDGVDGIHFTAQNNLDLGKAVAAKIVSIL